MSEAEGVFYWVEVSGALVFAALGLWFLLRAIVVVAFYKTITATKLSETAELTVIVATPLYATASAACLAFALALAKFANLIY